MGLGHRGSFPWSFHSKPTGVHSTGSTSQIIDQPFTTLADLLARLRPAGLSWQAAESLVLAGACDGLHPCMTRRQRLWQLHELWPLISPTRPRRPRRRTASRNTTGEHPPSPEQLTFAWDVTLDAPPSLPALALDERVALDYRLLGLSARPHPMGLLRRRLRRSGVWAIGDLKQVAVGRMARVAGWPISAQRPPTAKGMAFLVLEDETGRLPVAVPPHLAEQLYRRIRQARVVLVAGRVERVDWYHALLAVDLHELPGA